NVENRTADVGGVTGDGAILNRCRTVKAADGTAIGCAPGVTREMVSGQGAVTNDERAVIGNGARIVKSGVVGEGTVADGEHAVVRAGAAVGGRIAGQRAVLQAQRAVVFDGAAFAIAAIDDAESGNGRRDAGVDMEVRAVAAAIDGDAWPRNRHGTVQS